MNKYYILYKKDSEWVVHNNTGFEYDEAKRYFETLAARLGTDNVTLVYQPITTLNVEATIPLIRSSKSEMVVESGPKV